MNSRVASGKGYIRKKLMHPSWAQCLWWKFYLFAATFKKKHKMETIWSENSSGAQCNALLSYICYLFYSFKSLEVFNKMYQIRKYLRQNNPILYNFIQDLCCKPTFLLIEKKHLEWFGALILEDILSWQQNKAGKIFYQRQPPWDRMINSLIQNRSQK